MAAILNIMRADRPERIECGKVVTIGRNRANDAVLSESKVSRNHAILRRLAEDRYYLVDLGSSNGTFLNGKRVIIPAPLTDGDEITIGATIMLFRQEHGAGYDSEVEDATEIASMITTTIEPSIMEVTVLVADIRGYTTLSERIPVETLAKLLSRWFRGATEIIENNDGVIDKFIGDAVMARWLVKDQPAGKVVTSSLKAAYELHRMTTDVSAGFPTLPTPVRIGVGINTGRAAVGIMGSGRMQDYTVLGDSVNIAFRLESATKELGADLVMSDSTFEHVRGELPNKKSREIMVKGKDESVRVYTLSMRDLENFFTRSETTPAL